MIKDDTIEPLRSISTHNGCLTVISTKTGSRRTFRIRTQGSESDFCPNQRIVGLLVGPDNRRDYTQFGFVCESQIRVWRNHRSTKLEAYARMLERLPQMVASGAIQVIFATRCRICNRTLTTPESIQLGLGPKCGGRSR